jgi:hypothetical protein
MSNYSQITFSALIRYKENLDCAWTLTADMSIKTATCTPVVQMKATTFKTEGLYDYMVVRDGLFSNSTSIG